MYNEKHLKAKLKSYYGKINTNFYNNTIPKERSECICNFVFRTGENYYYPQVLFGRM